MLSLQSKTNLVPLSSIFLVVILVLLWLSSVSSASTLQQPTAREISFPIAIHWNKQTRARKYRLQIAADEKFHDIFFDAPVIGERYVAKELPAGYYFWRVAPAGLQLGSFSAPVRIFVSGGIVTPVSLPNRAKRALW